ncbi:MAG: DNA starvation/stationary phase protection protein [Tannerella sp.]|jgi:starvation-inducible DNA-binding protein|nr:DNA starvation/stationary phase protection protein [Tannerella sp.]
METENFIGLDSAAVKKVTDSLSDVLANRQVYYTNLRGLHWDIKGDKFFELHELYEGYYNNEASAIDEVAERIAMLGEHPENRFSEYLKKSDIKETHCISNWETGLNQVIATMKTLLGKYRILLALANEATDTGTVLLAGKHIADLETNLWKLTAYMG